MNPAIGGLGALDLRAEYDGRPAAALDALDVAPGEAVALIGPNGSGKSTLLRLLALVEAPTRGTITVEGRAVGPAAGDREARRAAVTLALPRPWLFVGTARTNVERGLAARGVPAADRRDRATAALASLGVGHLAERDARRLSSGESARVALARALVLATPVLLLDEPFAHLDPGAVAPAVAAIRARKEAGTAVVLAALRPEDLHGLEDRVVPVRAPGDAPTE